MEDIARDLLVQHLLTNPLPWRISQDWKAEVVASNGIVVARCNDKLRAERLVHAAEEVQKEIDHGLAHHDLWGV